MGCQACNQEVTYTFSSPNQYKFISITLSKKCRPSHHGRPAPHCRLILLDDNRKIYDSRRPACGPVRVGNGVHDVSMRLQAPEAVRMSVRSVGTECPMGSAGLCYDYEGYARICFCSMLQ